MMADSVAESNTLAYATGAPPELTRRAWRILLWLSAIHLLALLSLIGVTMRAMVSLFEFLRGASVLDWYVIGTIVHNGAGTVMMLVNALAVAGYAVALRGRSPRKWFLIYVPTQLALMLTVYALTIALALGSPHQVTPSSSMGMGRIAIVSAPVAFVIVALPLFLMLFPRIRRACLGR